MPGLIGAIVAAFIGVAVGFWLRSASAKAEKAQLAQRNLELSAELASERERLRVESQARAETDRTQAATIGRLDAELKAERQSLAEKVALLEGAKENLAHQFEALAGKILDEKSKTFSEGNQKELGTLLNPLRDQIKEFREKVEKAQSDSNIGVTKLETLIGSLGNLNQQLTAEAHNLTTALRGSSKAQGDWGELIVRNLLEKAGLREGEQFRVQETFDTAGNGDERQRKSRPDVIVNLPGNRHLIIDSKVSLNAYTDSVNAAADPERDAALKRHLASVRGHIDELAQRRYHKLGALETPDFVVMFIPIEPAFILSISSDNDLYNDAFDKNVVLVSPTTLLATLRTIANVWKQEYQSQNAMEIARQGADMYDKFVSFTEDLIKVGKLMDDSKKSYSEAMNKLYDGKGNLVRRAENMRKLGIKANKQLPQGLIDRAEE